MRAHMWKPEILEDGQDRGVDTCKMKGLDGGGRAVLLLEVWAEGPHNRLEWTYAM
jgi:hypothetical protein